VGFFFFQFFLRQKTMSLELASEVNNVVALLTQLMSAAHHGAANAEFESHWRLRSGFAPLLAALAVDVSVGVDVRQMALVLLKRIGEKKKVKKKKKKKKKSLFFFFLFVFSCGELEFCFTSRQSTRAKRGTTSTERKRDKSANSNSNAHCKHRTTRLAHRMAVLLRPVAALSAPTGRRAAAARRHSHCSYVCLG
jgi:hypothetical protein